MLLLARSKFVGETSVLRVNVGLLHQYGSDSFDSSFNRELRYDRSWMFLLQLNWTYDWLALSQRLCNKWTCRHCCLCVVVFRSNQNTVEWRRFITCRI